MACEQFLNAEFIMFSIAGGMGRGVPIYKKGIKETNSKRIMMKKEIKKMIFELGENYIKEKVNEEDHKKNIIQFSENISNQFFDILNDDNKNRFVVGRSQKLINLYLKYLWCWGKMPQIPPHCPFDSTIIAALRKTDPTIADWTKFDSDSLKEYEKYVTAAKEQTEKNNFQSIAEWELKTFNEQRRYLYFN